MTQKTTTNVTEIWLNFSRIAKRWESKLNQMFGWNLASIIFYFLDMVTQLSTWN